MIKLVTECTFKFNSRFLEQVDVCTMGGPLSVTFGDIYMVKMKNDVVIPSKSIFYHRFADDIYSRQKLGGNALFDQLNSYHSNITLSIEVNPSKFLDTKLTNNNGTYKFNIIGKTQNYFHHRPPKLYHCSKRISSNFEEEIPLIKEKFIRLITNCISLKVLLKNVEMKVL